jgi:hypothetical protein
METEARPTIDSGRVVGIRVRCLGHLSGGIAPIARRGGVAGVFAVSTAIGNHPAEVTSS